MKMPPLVSQTSARQRVEDQRSGMARIQRNDGARGSLDTWELVPPHNHCLKQETSYGSCKSGAARTDSQSRADWGERTKQSDNWYRFKHRPLSGQGPRRCVKNADWQTAWHGTKVQAVYAILWTGGIKESANSIDGERCLTGTAGVYLHNDLNKRKA